MHTDTILIVIAVALFCLGLYLIPRWRHWLFSLLLARVAEERDPDFIIGGETRPYMLRWWVIPRNRFFNIYLHNVLRSDDDRALHDHPWFNCSIVLKGGYFEVTPSGRFWRGPGSIKFRSPWARHRLELANDFSGDHVMSLDGGFMKKPAWTLFITGPVQRNWGFWCRRADGTHRFVPWRDFVHPSDPGLVGPGCGEPEA